MTTETPRLFVFCGTNDKITNRSLLHHSTTTSQKCKLPPTGLPSQYPRDDDFTKSYSYNRHFVKRTSNYTTSLNKEEVTADSTRRQEGIHKQKQRSMILRQQEVMSGSTITTIPIKDESKKEDNLSTLVQEKTERYPLNSNFSCSTTSSSSISSGEHHQQQQQEQQRNRRPTHRRRRNHALCEDDFEKVIPELFKSFDIDK